MCYTVAGRRLLSLDEVNAGFFCFWGACQAGPFQKGYLADGTREISLSVAPRILVIVLNAGRGSTSNHESQPAPPGAGRVPALRAGILPGQYITTFDRAIPLARGPLT